MTRQCGDCTLCCKVLGISELNKPVNNWCPHCDIGVGCKIYSNKPESCNVFECIWLQGDLPEEFKPNKCHIVFTTTMDEKRIIAHVDKNYPDAWTVPKTKVFIDRLAQVIDVIIVCGDKRKLLTTREVSQAEMLAIADQYRLRKG